MNLVQYNEGGLKVLHGFPVDEEPNPQLATETALKYPEIVGFRKAPAVLATLVVDNDRGDEEKENFQLIARKVLLQQGFKELGKFFNNGTGSTLSLLAFNTRTPRLPKLPEVAEGPFKDFALPLTEDEWENLNGEDFEDCCGAQFIVNLPSDAGRRIEDEGYEIRNVADEPLKLVVLDVKRQKQMIALCLEEGFVPVAGWNWGEEPYVLMAMGLNRPKRNRKR